MNALGTGEPAISIVMVAKNEMATLSRSMELILAQDVVSAFEVLVIDSGSTDGSVEYLQTLAQRDHRLHLYQIPPGTFHHARTRNLGISHAKGRYLVFLGGDALPTSKHWLRTLLSPILDGTERRVAATYGRQIPNKDANAPNYCRMTYNYGNTPTEHRLGSTGTNKERYFFSTVNCCIDRQLVDLYFDETIPIHEDIELSSRIIRGNCAIAYAPDASVVHSHNYGFWEILVRYYRSVSVFRQLGIFDEKSRTLSGDAAKFLRHSVNELQDRSPLAKVHFFLFFGCAGVGVKIAQLADKLPHRFTRWLSQYGMS